MSFGVDTTLTVLPVFFAQASAPDWQVCSSSPTAPQESAISTACAAGSAAPSCSSARIPTWSGPAGSSGTGGRVGSAARLGRRDDVVVGQNQPVGRQDDAGALFGRTTQIGARYGCFLPDLTGLARDLSAAGLPSHYISCRGCEGKRPLAWRAERHSRKKLDELSIQRCSRVVILLETNSAVHSKEHSHARASDHRRTAEQLRLG